MCVRSYDRTMIEGALTSRKSLALGPPGYLLYLENGDWLCRLRDLDFERLSRGPPHSSHTRRPHPPAA